MSDGFRVDPDGVIAHADAMREQAGRLSTARQAAEHPFAPDAYGKLCAFLAEETIRSEQELTCAVTQLAEVAMHQVEGVRDSAGAYRAMDERIAGDFRAIGGAR